MIRFKEYVIEECTAIYHEQDYGVKPILYDDHYTDSCKGFAFIFMQKGVRIWHLQLFAYISKVETNPRL